MNLFAPTNLALSNTLLASASYTSFMDRALNAPDVLAMPDPNVSFYCSVNSDDDTLARGIGTHLSDYRWAEVWLRQSPHISDLNMLATRLVAVDKIYDDEAHRLYNIKHISAGESTAISQEAKILCQLIEDIFNLKYRGGLAATIVRANAQALFKRISGRIYTVSKSPLFPQLRAGQLTEASTVNLHPYRLRPAQTQQLTPKDKNQVEEEEPDRPNILKTTLEIGGSVLLVPIVAAVAPLALVGLIAVATSKDISARIKARNSDIERLYSLASAGNSYALTSLFQRAEQGDHEAGTILGRRSIRGETHDQDMVLLNKYGNWQALATLFSKRLYWHKAPNIINEVSILSGRLQKNIELDREKAKSALQEIALYHPNIRQLLEEIGIHYEF